MSKPVERRLRERLERVRALHEGATTPGERAAAKKALDRVVEQLEQIMAKDEVRRFVWAHVHSLGVDEPRPMAKATALPGAQELEDALSRWERDTWTRAELNQWASEIVDGVVLPTDPHHEAACRAEVLLQLSSRDCGRLQPTDLPRVRHFLHDRDWTAWFELIAQAAHRDRRRAG